MQNKSIMMYVAVGLAAVLMTMTAVPAVACPIPVFQFSLEYWDSDPYEIEVQYDGQLTEEQQNAMDMLNSAQDDEEGKANIRLRWRNYADAAISPPEDLELPRIQVNYPSVTGIRKPLWEGPLETGVVEDLLHSPMRQQIAEKLLRRKAGVWVLLKSGDRRTDNAVESTLKSELERLERTLKVPDPMEEYGLDMGDIYTDIDFSLLTLRRDDPDEQMFIRMLLGSERDLDDYADKPMVFPIYGRGLIMYALVGDGINPWTLNDAGEFLTGPCSCQIKSSNPGVDILMSFDWASLVEQKSTYTMPGSVDTGGFLDRMEDAEEQLRE